MVVMTKEQVETVLDRAIENAQEQDQLVSITRKVKQTSPLDFFNRAEVLNKNRIFWTNPTNDFYLVAVGNVYNITASDDRFTIIKKEWEEIKKNAIIHNPYHVPGTGLVSVGGMSFDPLKPQTKQWKKYQACDFAIPEFLLTVDDGDYYLTENLFVKKGDDIHQLFGKLKQVEQVLFQSQKKSLKTAAIIQSQEKEVEYWKKTVIQATEEIKQNKAKKIVLARELRLQFDRSVHIGKVLENLLETQPNSYVFAFEKEGDCFLGATPERLVKVEKDALLSTCLAGTAPRGKTKTEDEQIAYDLLHDEKNRKEHDFVVQMIREAVTNYCTDVSIPDHPIVFPLKNLQHLYTPVTATLKPGYSIFDVVEKLHPTPALGGTPKLESVQFIREVERMDRGWYGAPIGWVDSNANGEFAVAIRSALVQQDEASLFAGCGVVENSDPELEYEETNIKFQPMLHVFQREN